MSETPTSPDTKPQEPDTKPVTEEKTATGDKPAVDKPLTEDKPAEKADTPATTTPDKTEPAKEKEETPAADPAAAADKAARRKKIVGALLDSALVLILVGAIGATGWYLKDKFDEYRVPSPMELLMSENDALCKKYESLREQAFHAEEQIHMRRRLTHLELRLGKDSQQIADLEASIAEQERRILAIMHEIRSTDREYRSVARSLLPGMPIGNATTTTGKVYRNAVIYRIDNKNVVLRTPEGQSRFPVRQLVKDNLPMLARYAFGLEDLIDMSVLNAREAAPAASAPAPAPAGSKPARRTETSYEPEAGAPIVNTDANKTSTSTEDDGDASQSDDGLAPW